MIVKSDPAIIQSYLEDSSNIKGGHAERVVLPENYEEVSKCLKEANDKRIAVTISGAGTGTSGGRVPFGGIILSTEKLNRIKGIKKEDSKGLITCQAGVLIKDLKSYADGNGLFYTYDPTEQNAFIGGTIATNASGARSFKYGSTRQSIYALTIALADGSIFILKRGEIKAKNNRLSFDIGAVKYDMPLPSYKMPSTKSSAGYFADNDMDLIDLFIGQEGTLACVLEATLKLNKKPEDILSCFAFFKSEEDALNFAVTARKLSQSRKKKDEVDIDALSIEYLDGNSLELLRKKFGNISGFARACVFFEQEINKSNEDKVIEKWEKLLSEYNAPIKDTWVAMNEKDRKDLFDKRHYLGEAMNELTKANDMEKVSTDIAVPNECFLTMMNYYKKILSDLKIQYYLFGHIGDSHIHLTLIPKDEKEHSKAKSAAMAFVKKSISLGGTVSAEHGIGKLRREYLKIMYGEEGIREMFEIKRALDPNLILGPGNIFSYKS